jgi:RHS repeat-associated protein
MWREGSTIRLGAGVMHSMTRRAAVAALVVALAVSALSASTTPSASALPSNSISYAYDDLGRLAAVIDPSQTNGVAAYSYDAVGNLNAINRLSSSGLSVVWVSPGSGAVGAKVIVYGTGFSATPANDTVKFNGTTATVTSATTTQLAVAVPTGASTGTVTVTVGASTATSPSTFTVKSTSGAPTISGFSPSGGVAGTAVTLSGTNFATTATNDVVAFNGIRAQTVSATATSVATVAPPAGSGRISIATPAGTATSSVDFIIPPSGYTQAQLGTPIRTTLGATVTATISTAGNKPLLLFDATAGQRLFVNATASSFTSASLNLYSTNNARIGSSSFGSSGGYLDTTLLPSTGTYSIVLDPTSPTTGSVTLTLTSVPADPSVPITVDGAPVTQTISAPGQNATATFTGSGGQRVFLNISGNTISSVSVRLNKPDGSQLDSTSLGGSSSYLDVNTLPTAGTYSIFVDPTGPRTGSITLTLTSVPADPSVPITVDGAPVTHTITAKGQNANSTFTGSVGQRVFVNVTGNTISVVTVRLQKPDGTTLDSTTTGSSTSYIDLNTLPTAGTYTLLVDPNGTATGSITLTLTSVPADPTGPITVGGAAVTRTITAKGQNAVATFTGTVGQKLTVTTSNSTISVGTLKFRNPDGTTLASTSFGTSATSLNATLTTAGTNSIYVDPNGTSTGSITLTLKVGTFLRVAGSPTLSTSTHQRQSVASPAKTLTPPSGDSANTGEPETWTPTARNRGSWKVERHASPLAALPPLPGDDHAAGLAGQVLRLNGDALAHVTVSVGTATTTTDDTGRFRLDHLPARHTVLKIDGRTANHGNTTYGVYEDGVDVAAGHITILDSTIWMTKLDTKHVVHFSYPLTKELVVSNPTVPGLEVHIPAGSTIKDEDGNPVTELGITPIPVDRPPFPLPAGVDVPVYFTVQPGGSYVYPNGAQIYYPNFTHQAPGSRVDFWNYDPDVKGWYVYGQGTVTADGSQVIPDKNVRVYEFTGAMINVAGLLADVWHGLEDLWNSLPGDPVDPSTGLFTFSKTDLAEPGSVPLTLTRTYRQGDTNIRPFGMGMMFPYQMFLSSANQYQEADLNLPDGRQVHFVRTSSGTGFTDAVFQAQSTATSFFGAVMSWNGNGWNIRLRDGTVYVYGENQPLQAIRDRYGNQLTITHSSGGQSGNVTQVTGPDGRWITFAYTSPNCTTCVSQATDQSGRSVAYTYDTNKRLATVTDVNGGVTTYTWNNTTGKLDQLLSIKDPRNITYLQNTYGANDRIATQTLADTGLWQFAYTLDGNNQVTQTDVTAPSGAITRYAYSGGQLTTITQALGTSLQATTSLTRDPTTHRITQTTDPLGRVTSYGYDTAGNQTTVTRLAGTPNALTTISTYDPVFNQRTSVTDPLNHATNYGYDAKGALHTITNATNQTTTINTDTLGHVTSVVDPANNTTSSTYYLGDLATVTDSLSRTTSQFVDTAGRVSSVTDPTGLVTQTTYDNANHPLTTTDPLTGTTTDTYDPNGNLLTVKDAKNHTTTYTYDVMDRMATRTDTATTPATATFTYDTQGRRATTVDRRGLTTAYSYDTLDRPTTVYFNQTAPGTYDTKIDYTYDAGNRLTQLNDSTPSSPSAVIARGYDGLNRLTSETVTPAGTSTPRSTVTYTYDNASRRATMTLTGQPVVTYGYDNANRLTSIVQGTTTVSRSIDSDGRLGTVTLPNGIVQTYGYDAASQLTGITYTRSGTTLGDLQYGYDTNGRRNGVGGAYARTNLPVTFTGTYGSANRLQTATINGVNSSYTYDANGNMTGDGTNTYVWDSRNQLSSTKVGSTTTASFAYDAVGRRAKKTISSTTTQFAYDGPNIIQEQDGTGGSNANLLTGLGVDTTYARTASLGTRSLTTDALGSTLQLTDTSGVAQTTYTYDPFGNSTLTGTNSTSSIQYTGRENDGNGLQYNRARYYNPTLGRFLSEDPIGFAGGQPNLYTYTGNSPTNYTDPTGNLPQVVVGCVVGGVVGGLQEAIFGTGRKDDVLKSAAIGCALGALTSVGGGAIAEEALAENAIAEDAAADGEFGLSDELGACHSFAYSTRVLLADGSSEPIGRVKVGDRVQTTDPLDGRVVVRTVTALHRNHDADRADLIAIDQSGREATVHTTSRHRFWDDTRHEWVDAVDLQPGDQLHTDDGGAARVVRIRPLVGAQWMYDLTIDDIHAFYVIAGRMRLLVHNCGRLSPDPLAEGPHSTFSRDPVTDEITHYATWEANPYPDYPSEWVRSGHYDGIGRAHFNKVTGEYVPTPHVQGPGVPGGVRPALPWEIPGGGATP